MELGMVSVGLLVLAALLLLLSAKVLFKNHWFMQFFRGFCGFSLLLVAVLCVLTSLNIATYKQLANGQVIGHISFAQTGTQTFEAVIMDSSSGTQKTFTLYGDMWQVSARNLQIAWVNDGFYQLNNIRSRYYALEQENSSSHNAYKLYQKSMGIDLWQVLGEGSLGLISAAYLIGSYVPMADGADYVLRVSDKGITVSAGNDAARAVFNH